jgi:FkbM family methyltransferase
VHPAQEILNVPPADRWHGVLYNVCARTSKRSQGKPFGALWRRLASFVAGRNVAVDTVIHGERVRVNAAYTYPIYARRYPSLNAPLIELVHLSREALGRPITFIDVGAAIGDTVLLIEANCRGAVGRYLCIDGDAEFFGYLRHNLARFAHVRCVHQVLGATDGPEPALVRIHGGTASAQGAGEVAARRLDQVLSDQDVERVDLLKIDVDGFDGEVLRGARSLLSAHRPCVIFEWHPILCEQTGKDPYAHFRALAESGYERFAWFTKFGDFSHFSDGLELAPIERLARLCRESRTLIDWHYDVVALPPGSGVDPVRLADLAFARRRRSRF